MRTTAFVLAGLLAGLVAAPVRAQGQELSPEQQQKLQELEQKIHAAFADGDYATAEKHCREEIAIVPDSPVFHYNLACALSRQGKLADGVQILRKAVELGFLDVEKISTDPDLEALKKDPGFADVIALANRKIEEQLAGTYEPGKPIEGVRTVEDAPEGGLRYRLHLPPDASAEKPARLVVWLGMALDEEGGSANDVVEPLAPRFAEKGFALLVLTEKQWKERWADIERERLVEVTLPAVSKRPDVDGSKPVLFGSGRGGTLAFDLWAENPGRWGGLLLNGAYPVNVDVLQKERRLVARDMPTAAAAKTVPILAFVSDAGQPATIWYRPELEWKAKGIPLTLEWVPGRYAEWYLEGERLEKALAWLGKLGK